jgi:hypothetical protein
LFASPFQLLENESATQNGKGRMEYKINGIYETGYIPVYLLRTGIRYGVFQRLEAGFQVEGAYFEEQELYRLADISTTLKLYLWKSSFYNFNLFAFGKYKHGFGDPVIVDFKSDKEELKDVVAVVSPFGDQGKDVTGGLMARNSITFFKKTYIYMFGVEYTKAMGREFGDFNEEQQNLYSFIFVPEYHFGRNYWMLALETKYTYWENRGHLLHVLPQIRWEFLPYFVLEMGVAVPVIGAGNNYRFIFGINIGKG